MFNQVLIILAIVIQSVAVLYCAVIGWRSQYRMAWLLAAGLSLLMTGVRIVPLVDATTVKVYDSSMASLSVLAPIVSAIFLGAAIIIRKLERDRSENASELEMRNSYLHALLNNAPDFIFTIDLDGLITYLNRAAAPIKKEDVIGTNWLSWLNEECKMKGRDAMDTVINLRQSTIIVVQLAPPDFFGRFYECHISPIVTEQVVNTALIIGRDITELHKKDEAVRESEERYRRLVESSRDAILVHCEAKIVFANSATAELFGAKEVSELLGMSPYSFVHPDFASTVRQRVRSAVVDKLEVPVIRVRCVRMDGTTRELLSTAHPYVWEGKPAIQVILKDITDLIRTQEALSESEARFKNLFDEMHVACGIFEVVTDESGKPIDFVTIETNPAFEKVTGFTRQQVVGKRIREAYPMASVEWVYALGLPAVTGLPVHFERYSPMLDKFLEVTSFRYGPGKFATVMADVTERRKAEEALRASEERFRQIAENMREACWLMDTASLKMIFVNKAHEEMYGFPAEEIYKEAFLWMKYIHPDDSDRIKSTIDRNVGVYAAVDTEFRIVRSDGTTRHINSRSFPILDSEGKPYRMAGIIEDITLLKRAEAGLLEHAEQLERKVVERSAQLIQSERLANLGRLVAGVAHEINNPVQTISSHLQSIENGDTLPQSVTERLKSVQLGLNRISSVTQQLRHLYRESPRDILAIDIRKVISDVLALYSSQLREQGIGIQIKLSDKPSLGLCNEGAIHEALGNLLVNAMDAMPEGGSFEVSLESDSQFLRIVVNDTGHGISPAVIDRIFEPFFTTKPVGSGTGLGLAISRESLETVGCSITASSDGPGNGATFTISIPRLSAQ